MAREDQTFTSGDVIRIWCNNLDKEEQKWVVVFFLTVVPGIYFSNDEIIDALEVLKKSIKQRTFKIILDIVIKNMDILRRILNTEWANLIFESPLRGEVTKCINKRLDRRTGKKTKGVPSFLQIPLNSNQKLLN